MSSISRYKAVQAMSKAFLGDMDRQQENREQQVRDTRMHENRKRQATHRQGLLDESWRSRQEYRPPNQDAIDRRQAFGVYHDMLREQSNHYGEMIFDYQNEVRGSQAFAHASPQAQQSMLSRPTRMSQQLTRLNQQFSSEDAFNRWYAQEWSPDYSTVLSIAQQVDRAVQQAVDVAPQDGGVGGGNTVDEPNISDDELQSLLDAVIGTGDVGDAPVADDQPPTQTSSQDRVLMESHQRIMDYVRQNGTLPPGGLQALVNISRQLGHAVAVPQGLNPQEAVAVQVMIQNAIGGN